MTSIGSDLPLAAIEAARDDLERLATSELPIAQDARSTLELLDGQKGQEGE